MQSLQSIHDIRKTAYLFLLFTLICLRIQKFSVAADNLHDDKTDKSFSSGGVTNEDSDYEYDGGSPEEQVKKDAVPTIIPYFDKPQRVLATAEGKQLILTCPVKNLSDSQHSIIWYKENNTITNGKLSLNNHFDIDGKYSLTIKQLSNETIGNYSCRVLPHDVRQHILVKIGEIITTPATPNTSTTTDANNQQINLTPDKFLILINIFILMQSLRCLRSLFGIKMGY